jgi:uncharacterized coiled-coil protein SlyX
MRNTHTAGESSIDRHEIKRFDLNVDKITLPGEHGLRPAVVEAPVVHFVGLNEAERMPVHVFSPVFAYETRTEKEPAVVNDFKEPSSSDDTLSRIRDSVEMRDREIDLKLIQELEGIIHEKEMEIHRQRVQMQEMKARIEKLENERLNEVETFANEINKHYLDFVMEKMELLKEKATITEEVERVNGSIKYIESYFLKIQEKLECGEIHTEEDVHSLVLPQMKSLKEAYHVKAGKLQTQLEATSDLINVNQQIITMHNEMDNNPQKRGELSTMPVRTMIQNRLGGKSHTHRENALLDNDDKLLQRSVNSSARDLQQCPSFRDPGMMTKGNEDNREDSKLSKNGDLPRDFESLCKHALGSDMIKTESLSCKGSANNSTNNLVNNRVNHEFMMCRRT